MKRLYATRVDTRKPYSFVAMAFDMALRFRKSVWCIADVTNDYAIIFLTTCTASDYDAFKRRYLHMTDWIEFDYFNQNRIED